MSDKDGAAPAGTVSYAEMRQVAQEIHRLEKQARQIRTGALVCVGLLVGTAVFAGVIALLVAAFTETEIKEDGGQLAMVKKDTDKVVATTQSLEDIDGSDLVSYAKTKKLADGTMDGEWTLSDERIALIRTISWKAGPVLEVHYVSEIVRHDGAQTRVEITTKAGHLITLWDDQGLKPGETKNEVFIKRFNKHTNKFGPEEEVNPNGDEAGQDGRGRVLVSLSRPTLAARPRPINVDDFFDDDA
jgi:hypothetical protein